MTFYYQPLSDRSWEEQRQAHFSQASFLNNIEDFQKAQTAEYNATLREVSSEQAEIMRSMEVAICGTISDGLADVTEGLDRIEDGIHNLTNLLDFHLRAMVNEMRYNNILTQNILLMLREPDSEKVRQKNIEKGLKFFNDGDRNPDFYDDALLFLTKAKDEDHTDYLVLHKIGLIHLNTPGHVNYHEAIKYFKESAKYSEADAHPDSKRLADILVGDITKPLHLQSRSLESIKYITGESHLQTATAYYRQGKFGESIEYSQRAIDIAPLLLEAGFFLAKSLAASGQNEKAAEILRPVIQQDPKIYSIKTLKDGDLATKREILLMVEELKSEEGERAIRLLDEASRLQLNFINEWEISESKLATEFNELSSNLETAKELIDKGDYLRFLAAQENVHKFTSNFL